MERPKTESFTITLDDDPIVGRSIQAHTGIHSLAFSSFKDLESHPFSHAPQAIFVDVYLGHDENGIDHIPNLRARWPYTPIIVVTSDMGGDSIGQALAAGANDFIRKPIDPRELSARLRARSVEMSERSYRDCLTFGDIEFNVNLHELKGPLGIKHITPSDARLLHYLIQSHGITVPRADLKRKIWGNVTVSENALDQKLHDLRRALRELGSKIKVTSIYRQGFCLVFSNSHEPAA